MIESTARDVDKFLELMQKANAVVEDVESLYKGSEWNPPVQHYMLNGDYAQAIFTFDLNTGAIISVRVGGD